jgi:hypothetical protein
MLLLLPSITLRLRIHVRMRAVPCAHTSPRDLHAITPRTISGAGCWVISDTKHPASSHAGRTAAGRTGQVALGENGYTVLGNTGRSALVGVTRHKTLSVTGHSAPSATGQTTLECGNEIAATPVDCHRDTLIRSGYERKIPARVNAGNSTVEMISEGSLDQSAARAARLRAFGAAAPAASSGKSASCSKSRRSSQLEKLRPSRAASVRAKASRSARNDTLVWVLPRARTPWRLFVLGVLTHHHPRKSFISQYKNATK